MTDTALIDDRAEELVIKLADQGVFRIDPERGEIWRTGHIRAGKFYPIEPERRAESKRPNNGYLRIRVMVNGIRIHVSAHRVIYRYHHGTIPEGHLIDHKNEIVDQNYVGNLQAVTPAQNVRLSLERNGKSGPES